MRVTYTIAGWAHSDCSAGGLKPSEAVPRERARLYSVLNHCELNLTTFNLTYRQLLASYTLERIPTLVEITECLILAWKRCLEATRLPNRADGEYKADRLSLICLRLGHNPDIFGH
jgi:hypothetical protein